MSRTTTWQLLCSQQKECHSERSFDCTQDELCGEESQVGRNLTRFLAFTAYRLGRMLPIGQWTKYSALDER